MAVRDVSSLEQVARIVHQCLLDGGSVDIDGLGSFRPKHGGGFEFVPQTSPKVFLAYVVEDAEAVERLYTDLVAHAVDAWMDRKRLLPGQNWPRSIEHAIAVSDFFIACFSQGATGKRGSFQSELRYALDCARRLPLDEVFFIPVRLEECHLPARIVREFQYVDLFPNWEKGLHRILAAIKKQAKARRLRLAG
jgi:hypothetical protein